MIIIIVCACTLYAALVMLAAIGLQRLPQPHKNQHQPLVSIIIPARNEEKKIATCLDALLAQQYSNYEIIVIDDHSTDRTADITSRYASQHHRVKLYRQADVEGISPKKAALTLGITHATGELVFTTDADCIAGPDWLQHMTACFEPDVALVAGWLRISDGPRLLHKIEALDSFALVLVGAAGFGWKKPFMANGANLAYRKSVFNELGGFTGSGHYASGDDDLLLQKISAHPNWRCAFCTDTQAAVFTPPQPDLCSILRQRFRWASKAGIYPGPLVVLEIFLYLFILAAFWFVPLSVYFSLIWLFPALVKLTVDVIFFYYFTKKWATAANPFIMLLADFFQMAYVLLAGVWGIIGTYQWKDRHYTRGQIRKK